MGLFGGGNSSNTTLQTSNNYDQRSIQTTTDSNNTTHLYDASATNSNNTNITTDSGAIAGAISLARDLGNAALGLAGSSQVHAYDYADQIFSGALDAVNRNDARALDAYDRASHIQEAAVGQLQGAYADAKGTSDGQQKIILAVLAVAGVFALSTIGK